MYEPSVVCIFRCGVVLVIRLGTRTSQLAMAQTNLVVKALKTYHAKLDIEIVPIETSGDLLSTSLADIGGKALFSKELQQALLDGRIDGAVHSCKDIECHDLPLIFGAILPRISAHDVLVLRADVDMNDQNVPMTCGTSAPRRKMLMQHLYPYVKCVDLRGNVITRLQKISNGVVDVIVLASAGLKRLGYHTKEDLKADYPNLVMRDMDIKTFIPAAAQGVIAVECVPEKEHLFSCIDDPLTRLIVSLERAFVRFFDGHCRTAIAAHIYYDSPIDKKAGYYFSGYYEGVWASIYLGENENDLRDSRCLQQILTCAHSFVVE